jgi:hypothetical protein
MPQDEANLFQTGQTRYSPGTAQADKGCARYEFLKNCQFGNGNRP